MGAGGEPLTLLLFQKLRASALEAYLLEKWVREQDPVMALGALGVSGAGPLQANFWLCAIAGDARHGYAA